MRRILILAVAGALVLGLTSPVSAADHLGDPVKVAICHFDGHDFEGTHALFDGDYVINFGTDGPTPTFCEETLGEYAGNMIIVAVKALKGHGVQLLDRIDDYPDGWKG